MGLQGESAEFTYSTEEEAKALVSSLRATADKIEREIFEDYGMTEPSNRACRAHLRKQFESVGLTFEGARSRHGAVLLFKKPNGEACRIATYIINNANKFDQCSFTVNHITDMDPTSEIHWVVLVAKPFRRTYLKRMSEIRAKYKNSVPEKVNITIREGSPESDLFRRRIKGVVT